MCDREKMDTDLVVQNEQALDLDDNWETDSSSASSQDLFVKVVGKKKKTTTRHYTTIVLYQCPVCHKRLKTIAGFRGHMWHTHGCTDVKASSHRVSPSSQPGSPVTPKKPTTPPRWIITNMAALVTQSLRVIQQYKLNNTPSSHHGHFMVEMASHLTSLGSVCESSLASHLGDVVSVLATGPSMQLDRCEMYAAYHQMRFNPDLLGALTAEIDNTVPDHLRCYIEVFVQIFLDELLDAVLEEWMTKTAETGEKC